MKQNKLKLNGATISGPGMTHAINPSIIAGPEDNGYAKGELMDANAVKQAVDSLEKKTDAIDDNINTIKEVYDFFDGVDDSANLVEMLGKINEKQEDVTELKCEGSKVTRLEERLTGGRYRPEVGTSKYFLFADRLVLNNSIDYFADLKINLYQKYRIVVSYPNDDVSVIDAMCISSDQNNNCWRFIYANNFTPDYDKMNYTNSSCDISSIVIGVDNNGDLCLWRSYVGINETFVLLLYYLDPNTDVVGYGDHCEHLYNYTFPTWKCLNCVSVDDAWRYPSVNIMFIGGGSEKSVYHATPATETFDHESDFRGIGFTYITTPDRSSTNEILTSNKHINFIWLCCGSGNYPYKVLRQSYLMRDQQMDLKVLSEPLLNPKDNTIYFIKEQ